MDFFRSAARMQVFARRCNFVALFAADAIKTSCLRVLTVSFYVARTATRLERLARGAVTRSRPFRYSAVTRAGSTGSGNR